MIAMMRLLIQLIALLRLHKCPPPSCSFIQTLTPFSSALRDRKVSPLKKQDPNRGSRSRPMRVTTAIRVHRPHYALASSGEARQLHASQVQQRYQQISTRRRLCANGLWNAGHILKSWCAKWCGSGLTPCVKAQRLGPRWASLKSMVGWPYWNGER